MSRIPNAVMAQRIDDVARLKKEGYTYAQIAALLGISKSQAVHAANVEINHAAVGRWQDKHREYYKDRYQSLRMLWIDGGETCVCCGKPAECRHHIVYAEKSFAMREIINGRNLITENDIAAEKLKTVPMCISCHRKVHLGVIVDDSLYKGPIQTVYWDERGRYAGVAYEVQQE